jgi:glyoxylase I family protein
MRPSVSMIGASIERLVRRVGRSPVSSPLAPVSARMDAASSTIHARLAPAAARRYAAHMDQRGCGCPPTTGAGRVHHVIVNTNDLERARAFYGWLLPRLGYAAEWPFAGGFGWLSPAGSFWLKPADARFAGDRFHKDRVGLCEIAFAATSRDEVDALGRALVERGVPVLDPPREYPDYVPGYYAVFFTDPDGLKLELVHVPGALS